MQKLVVSFVVLLALPAFAQQRQGQAQDQRQNIVFNNSREKQPVGRAFAHVPRPTSDCMGSFGAGAQGSFAGITFSGTKQSQPCNDRENAESVAALGMVDMAQRMRIIVICQDRRYKELEECIDLKIEDKDSKKVCDYPTKCARLQR